MSLEFYPPVVLAQDLSPDEGFGPAVDAVCERIREATDGWGGDKKALIDVLGTRDATQRTHIAMRYKELHNHTLRSLIGKKFSGNFKLALEFLSLEPNKADCAMIRRATKGSGVSVKLVWSILCGRSNREMELLKKTYFQLYDKDLGQLMTSELGGSAGELVINCLQASEEEYDPQYHTEDKAKEDAKTIYEHGQGRFGTDEKGIFKVLCASPPEHLKKIDQEYSDRYGYTLWKAMEKELGGLFEKDVRDGVLHLIGMKLKPFETMAKVIDDACRGFGVDELLLMCCIIRFQPHMGNVMAAHAEEFSTSIDARVQSELGGHMRKLLLQVLKTAQRSSPLEEPEIDLGGPAVVLAEPEVDLGEPDINVGEPDIVFVKPPADVADVVVEPENPPPTKTKPPKKPSSSADSCSSSDSDCDSDDSDDDEDWW